MNILLVYCVAIMGASLVGGKLSELMTMTHLRMQLVMSLVSGFIVGIAVHHLLPHSMEYISGPKAWEHVSLWMLAGIVMMVLLLQTFNFHQHEIPDTSERATIHPASLWGILFGLVLHSSVEGIALGAGVLADLNRGGSMPESLGIFLVILFHKPLDAWTIMGLAKSSGQKPSIRTLINILFSLITPLTMILSYWGMGALISAGSTSIVGYIMAFASGTFLCISLSDLLPEIQSHRHDRGKLTLTFLGGIALSCALRLWEQH